MRTKTLTIVGAIVKAATKRGRNEGDFNTNMGIMPTMARIETRYSATGISMTPAANRAPRDPVNPLKVPIIAPLMRATIYVTNVSKVNRDPILATYSESDPRYPILDNTNTYSGTITRVRSMRAWTFRICYRPSRLFAMVNATEQVVIEDLPSPQNNAQLSRTHFYTYFSVSNAQAMWKNAS